MVRIFPQASFVAMALAANPFGKNAHGLAGGGVDLRFAPGAGFGEADAVEMGNDELHASGGADEHDAHGFARICRLSAGWVAGGRQAIDFAVGDEF